MQILFGNLIYAVVCWIIMMALGFIMYGKTMLTKQVMLMALNAFVFSLVGLSISFMVGSVLKSRNTMSAVTNVLTLGMSFTSGVFVPQYLLGEQVLSFAQILPTYWFVKFNNEIINMEHHFRYAKTIIGLHGYAAASLLRPAVALVIIKQKRQAEEA